MCLKGHKEVVITKSDLNAMNIVCYCVEYKLSCHILYAVVLHKYKFWNAMNNGATHNSLVQVCYIHTHTHTHTHTVRRSRTTTTATVYQLVPNRTTPIVMVTDPPSSGSF